MLVSSLVFSEELIVSDERPLLLKNSKQTLGSMTYGQFLYCIQHANYSGDDSRMIDMRNKRLIIVLIENKTWFIEIREEIESVIIESITINTHHHATLVEQSRLLLYIFSHCHLPEG